MDRKSSLIEFPPDWVRLTSVFEISKGGARVFKGIALRLIALLLVALVGLTVSACAPQPRGEEKQEKGEDKEKKEEKGDDKEKKEEEGDDKEKKEEN